MFLVNIFRPSHRGFVKCGCVPGGLVKHGSVVSPFPQPGLVLIGLGLGAWMPLCCGCVRNSHWGFVGSHQLQTCCHPHRHTTTHTQYCTHKQYIHTHTKQWLYRPAVTMAVEAVWQDACIQFSFIRHFIHSVARCLSLDIGSVQRCYGTIYTSGLSCLAS